mmetsp:Transcript_10712/g.39332  ORF Transcript_10712/g.39332 Transcript_10712/m.39332 type:complete len:547 (-) Transcript_10712:136-1776(-)
MKVLQGPSVLGGLAVGSRTAGAQVRAVARKKGLLLGNRVSFNAASSRQCGAGKVASRHTIPVRAAQFPAPPPPEYNGGNGSNGNGHLTRDDAPSKGNSELQAPKQELPVEQADSDIHQHMPSSVSPDNGLAQRAEDYGPGQYGNKRSDVGEYAGHAQEPSVPRSAVIGKQVVSGVSGRVVGVATNLYVDSRRWEVVMLEVRESLLQGEPEALPLDSVYQIGDVVLIEEENDWARRDSRSWFGMLPMMGIDVVTRNGTYLGKIRDLRFNPEYGTVQSFVFDSFGLPMLPPDLISTYQFDLEEVIGVTANQIVLERGVELRLKQLTRGVMEKLAITDPVFQEELDRQMGMYSSRYSVEEDWRERVGGISNMRDSDSSLYNASMPRKNSRVGRALEERWRETAMGGVRADARQRMVREQQQAELENLPSRRQAQRGQQQVSPQDGRRASERPRARTRERRQQPVQRARMAPTPHQQQASRRFGDWVAEERMEYVAVDNRQPPRAAARLPLNGGLQPQARGPPSGRSLSHRSRPRSTGTERKYDPSQDRL